MAKWKVAYEGPPQRIALPQGGYLCPACLQHIRANEMELAWDITKLKLECFGGEAHRFSACKEPAS
jgi:hypothetical protein